MTVMSHASSLSLKEKEKEIQKKRNQEKQIKENVSVKAFYNK